MSHDRPITLQQPVEAHPRHDVGGPVHIVTGDPAGYPVFLLKPIKKPGPGRGIQYAYHCGRNSAFLNEIDLPLKDGVVVAVEADDKATQNLQSGTLDHSDILKEISVFVLVLMAFRKAGLIG